MASAIAVEDGAPSSMLLWGVKLESASPPALRTTEKSECHSLRQTYRIDMRSFFVTCLRQCLLGILRSVAGKDHHLHT